MPEYIIVSFPEYCGPLWDRKNPTHVPVPVVTKKCKKNYCCCFEYVPLQLAFARTIHKFQGQQVGDGNLYKQMVFDPGTTNFEGNDP